MYKKTVLIISVILLILILNSPVSLAEDIEWKSSVDSRTLSWGDSLNVGDFTIKAEDFTKDDLVYLSISKDGAVKADAPLRFADTLEYDDEIRVYVKKVDSDVDSWTGRMSEPEVEVQVFKRGIPKIKINIESDQSTYDPKKSSESTFEIEVQVENDGDAKAENVFLEIDVGNLELTDGTLVHSFSEIKKGESSETIKLKFKTPLFWENTDISLNFDARGHDIKGDKISAKNEKVIEIKEKWGISLSKMFTQEMYINEIASSSLVIRNTGLVTLDSIEVKDHIHDNFAIKENKSLETTVSLAPGDSIKLFEYRLIPDRPGDFTIPRATAIYVTPEDNEHEITSNRPECEIEGPYITVDKQVSDQAILLDNNVEVNLDIRNRGNKDASVTLEEQLPEGAVLVEGDLKFNDIIKKGSKSSLSYTLKFEHTGEFNIPSSQVHFVDLRGHSGTVESRTITISVQDEHVSVNENEDTDISDDTQVTKDDEYDNEDVDRVQPGFEVIISLFVIAIMYIMLNRRD